MKPKYCIYLNNGINLHYSGLTFCNKLWKSCDYQQYDKKTFDTFLEKRAKVLFDMSQGNAPKNCEKCIYLKEIGQSEQINDKILFVEVTHWTECNCACFYCSNRDTTKLKISKGRRHKGVVNVLDYLKKLHKLNLLDENVKFSMTGGEPTILREFPDLLKFFIKHKYTVDILSNGILYEKYISKALVAKLDSSFTISIDCSDRETFKKIKGVDKFDDVIKNIKRYVKETEGKTSNIIIKYILLKGVNDSKEQIDNWINLCVSLGIKNLFITIEFCHSATKAESPELTNEICELYQYAKDKIKSVDKNLTVLTYDFVEEMIKKRSYSIK